MDTAILPDPSHSHHLQQQQQQQQQQPHVERLNPALQQQLNLESVKTRAISLYKAISRILEDFDVHARMNTVPKWQDVLGQFSMLNLELFSIVEDMRKVSKAFIVHPRNVNAENSTILPVMLSTKSFPEMESDDNSKREQILNGMQNLPISTQIERLKARIDMIGAACDSAEKIITESRKAYSLSNRPGPVTAPIDKVQAAEIHEKENLLRAAVNFGEGLHMTSDNKSIATVLPPHLADVLMAGDGVQAFTDPSGILLRNSQSILPSNVNNQAALLQAASAQLLGRTTSPSAVTIASSVDSTTASPLPYANSPRSASNAMNTPSPQQQTQHQHQYQQQQLHQQQFQQQQQQLQQQQLLQRQKILQLPQHQQQILAQQFRQSPLMAQNQMQFPQNPSGHQQFQGRLISSGHLQQSIAQNQLNQGNQLSRHLGQFSGNANNALFNAAQSVPSGQVYGISGVSPDQTHASQVLNDQMFHMGAAAGSSGGVMPLLQEQQQQQHQFGNMAQTSQNAPPPNRSGFQQHQTQPNQQ